MTHLQYVYEMRVLEYYSIYTMRCIFEIDGSDQPSEKQVKIKREEKIT